MITDPVKLKERIDDVTCTYEECSGEFLQDIFGALDQIKTELEAWNVVKNKSVDMLMFMLYYDNLEEYNNYIKSLEGECDYEKCLLTQEEANSIKKALEVHNNE